VFTQQVKHKLFLKPLRFRHLNARRSGQLLFLVEKFVATPQLSSENSVGVDLLEPVQV